MHGNLQETLSENYSQNGPENLPEDTAYHHNYYEIQSASNRPPSEQQNYNIQLQAIHQKGQKTYNLRLPVPHKENDQLQRSMTRQGRRSRVIMDINQNQNVPQTTIKQKSNKVLKLFDLQNQGGQVQDVVVEKTKDFQGNIQVNTLPIEVNGYKQKRQNNKQGDQKLKGKAVAIQKGGETVVKKDELFQKKMLKEPKHNTQQIKQTQQNIKDEAKYQEQILQSSVKRSRLFEVAKDKETGLQKNILFQSKNNDDDYIVSPQYNSRSSLDTGLQITTSRDQFSSRQIIQNKSLVVAQKGSRKRLPALQPLNSVLKNNEKKLYQLKNYEKLEQKHKISKRLKNGNYCIHNDQIQDVYNFIRGKIPHHRTLESTIVRNKECRKLWFLDYDFNTNQGKYLLSCKKMPFHFFSTYNISLLKNQFKDGSQYLIGRIEANFTGSIFNIYTPKEENNKQMQISATIYYSPDFTCCKVNARQIEVYLKNESYLFQDLEGVNEKNKNLKELYEIESNRERKKISKFVNKKAVWREYLQAFVLNFRGKSKVPSVKNMILESDDDRKQEALLLAKSQTNQFQLDISYPFSPLIGFAVAITSFDFKLATQ